MPVDYSKWDALELSDDSDIEVHPNVDKRSFIRAKQNQIHMERQQRKHQIETLKYERIVNDGLISRISALLTALRRRAPETESRDPGAVAFAALMDSTSTAADEAPPPRPQGIHDAEAPLPSYATMLSSLLDQVNKALDEKQPADRYAAMVDEIAAHLAKAQNLQRDLLVKLAELEKADHGKITSESYRTGFDSSFVNKEHALAAAEAAAARNSGSSSDPAAAASAAKEPSKPPTTTVELLNPPTTVGGSTTATTAAAAAITTQPANDDEDGEIRASAAAREFAKITPADYASSRDFIARHPALLADERDTDGLLMLALDAATEQRDAEARRCVHQALLLQYCRALGRDGVAVFFKRITTPGHQAQAVFYKDVQDTYARIRERGRALRAAVAEQGGGAGGAEQIQLQAVDPDTEIVIRVPPTATASSEGERGKEEQAAHARAIFESFSPDLRRALESGRLDSVNEALGRLAVEEAEEVVRLLGEADILSLVDNRVFDTTTEEGKKELLELQEAAALEQAEEVEKDPE